MNSEVEELVELAADYYDGLMSRGVHSDSAGRITAAIIQPLLASSLAKNMVDEAMKGLDSVR